MRRLLCRRSERSIAATKDNLEPADGIGRCEVPTEELAVTHSVHSVQSKIQQDQDDRAVQPPKTNQQKTQSEPLQDKVTISNSSGPGSENQ
jgi:hypothetical protein